MKFSTKILSAVISFVLIAMMIPAFGITASAAPWNGSTGHGFESGTGTETDPYIIKTAEQLKYLESLVNHPSSPNDMTGTFIKLGADIDLGGKYWEPIGRSKYRFEDYLSDTSRPSTAFSGSFDGDGYTISNYVVTSGTYHADKKYDRAGLFGVIDGATVKNLNVSGATVMLEGTASTYCGAIIAHVKSDKGPSLISNCTTDSTCLVGAKTSLINISVGGIVGRIDSVGTVVEYCINNAKVEAEAPVTVMIGGVIGTFGGGTVKCCVNKGDVEVKLYPDGTKGSFFVGGIVGTLGTSAQGGVRIENCYNTGKITSGHFAGGIGGGSHVAGNVLYNNYNLSTTISGEKDLDGKEINAGLIVGNNKSSTETFGNASVAIEGLGFCGSVSLFVDDQFKYDKVMSAEEIGLLTAKIDNAIVMRSDAAIIPVINTDEVTTTTLSPIFDGDEPTDPSITTTEEGPVIDPEPSQTTTTEAPANTTEAPANTTETPANTTTKSVATTTEAPNDEDDDDNGCGGMSLAAVAAMFVATMGTALVIIKRK